MGVELLSLAGRESSTVRNGWAESSSLAGNNFDFLRWALAVLVILSHSFALLSGSDETEPLMRWTGSQLTFGGLAVNWFFVISGFLITHSWLRCKSLPRFLRKRACRILPGFVLAMLFCGLVVAPLASENAADAFTRSQIAALLRGILTLRGYEYARAFSANPYPGAINGSLWSISYECWCYLGVAALGLAGLLRRRRSILVLFLASIVISVLFLVLHLRPGGKWLGVILGSPRLWARLLPYYLSGVVFYLLKEYIPWSCWQAWVSATVLLAGCVFPNGLAVALPTAGTYLLF